MRQDPEAKHYRLFELLRDIYFQADDLDDELLRWERKYELAPRVPFGAKVGNFFRGLKGMARKLKIQAVSLPAASPGMSCGAAPLSPARLTRIAQDRISPPTVTTGPTTNEICHHRSVQKAGTQSRPIRP